MKSRIIADSSDKAIKPKNETSYNQWDNLTPWNYAINTVEVVVLCCGFLANILMLNCIFRHKMASKLTNVFLKVQCSVDASVCVIGLSFLVQPLQFWQTGNVTLDAFICHVWHSQLVYWYLVFLSVQNLVCTACDRFWAVVMPQNYKARQTVRMKACIMSLFAYTILVGSPNAFLTYFSDGKCISRSLLLSSMERILMTGFAVLWVSTIYLIPTLLFVILYSKIILTLYKSNTQINRLRTGRNIKALQLTRAMIIITLIFIASISFDSLYFLFSATGMVHYVINSPWQRVGVFLVSVNSSVNVFVYCGTMSSFRKLFLTTYCSCCWSGAPDALPRRYSTELRKSRQNDSIGTSSFV